MDMRVLGIPMHNRHPLQLRPEIDFHSADELSRQPLQIEALPKLR
jgi:hypothetical protein